MSQERFISELITRYPKGSAHLENEIRTLKRKLDDAEFSDIDEEQYCRFANSEERNIENRKKNLTMKNKERDMENRKKNLSMKNKESEGIYNCDICAKTFNRKSNIERHKLSHRTSFECEICHKRFKRRDYLTRHKKAKHNGIHTTNFTCKHCHVEFNTYNNLFQHITANHPLSFQQTGGKQSLPEKSLNDTKTFGIKSMNDVQNQLQNAPQNDVQNQFQNAPQNDVQNQFQNARQNGVQNESQNGMQNQHQNVQQNALQNTIQDRIIYPKNAEQYDLLTFLANIKSEISDFLTFRLRRHGVKWHLSVQVELVKEDAEGNVTAISEPHFRSLTYTTLNVETLSEHDLNEAFHKISKSLEAYLRDASGWTIRKVIQLRILTVNYSPLAGSSYVKLPETLQRSHCILNIRNYNDEKCFAYSVLASLYPAESQPELASHYEKYVGQLNMQGIQYPVQISRLDKFESQNENISVNVFTFEQNEILPLRITKQHARLHHINLLLLQNEKTTHYCLIKDINKFLSRLKKCCHSSYVCNYCLHMFTKQSLLDDHIPYCRTHGPQKIEVPTERNCLIEFKDYEKTLPVPFVIYADFETLNKNLTSCDVDPNQSSTTATTLLTPCSFGYKVVSTNPKYSKSTVIYRGQDAAERLIECLLKEKEEIEQILQDIQPLNLTKSDYKLFHGSDRCCICQKLFVPREQRARHHDHFTGQFIGAAHMTCNLQCKQSKFIPVVFHGLKNFDAHCLCQSIGVFKDSQLKCIPQNMERYVSFSIDSLRFIDSFQFLPSSLETLVESLSNDGSEAFKHLHEEFSNSEHTNLLMRKGIYPYDYMNDENKFTENKLPKKEYFYSEIKREHISNKDYKHAQSVFHVFACQNLGDYHDLYLKTDVLLLCDVFEQFRKVCLKQYELDPCHFYTSPGLSWQALLKKTGIVLQLMTDIDQILFIERGIRGGISQISNRYKKANNEFVAEYDDTKTKSFLSYIDANNLYGSAMSQPLPHGFFRFLEENEIDTLNIPTIPADGSKGYILEVSLKYPKHLHNDHNDLPLAPESKHTQNEELSPYAQRVLKKLNKIPEDGQLPQRSKVSKLLTTLYDKEKYVVHYRNLQLYLQLGLEITKIHRVLEFGQEPWMKPYVEFNTEMRKKARSAFEKLFYKLMNNAVFGKTMENVRKHKNVELCHREKRMIKLSAKPTYKTHRIFSEDLVAVELLRAKVTLNKPMYVGMSVLDLSKHIMYDFYYNHLKKMYGENLQLQMTDTDSFLFYCETENIFEDMKEHLHLFDTSDFPKEHPLHSDVNKKVLGKMKSETNEKCISEFVGLRSKMYAYSCDGQEEKRAKGISKVTVNKDLRLESYKYALFNETQLRSKMTLIRSHGHEIFCENVVKTGLSCFDDKRFLLEDGISSLAYGHYKLKS